jgi:hypothetical protein
VGDAELPVHLQEMEVVDPHQLGVVDVDDLAVQDLLGQGDAVGRRARRGLGAGGARPHHHGRAGERLHRGPGELEPPLPGLHHQALHRRVGLAGGRHQVGELAEVAPVGGPDRAAEQLREVEEAGVAGIGSGIGHDALPRG